MEFGLQTVEVTEDGGDCDDAAAALNAMAALALLAPDLRLVLYASALGEASRRVLVVERGRWSFDGASAIQEAA